MKLKEGNPMTSHLNAFQSMVNQLVPMKMVMNDEMLTFLLPCLQLANQENFVITVSNYILNDALSRELVKGNFYNEETRMKTSDIKNAQVLITKVHLRQL